MRRALIAVLACCLLAGCGGSDTVAPELPAGRSAAAPTLSSRVDTQAIMATLRRLEAIAREHGGNRAAGTGGGEATLDEIAERMKAAGYAVSTQAVSFPFAEERSRPRVAVDGRALASPRDVLTLAFSSGGEVEGAVAVAARVGCAGGDYARAIRDAIAVVRRGQCTLRRKAALAQRAGARGLLIINDGSSGGTGPFAGTLGSPGLRIPVLGVSVGAGRQLLRSGAKAQVRVDAISERRRTRNVIAETTRGRRAGTLVLGAHADSVPAGPGINDNGTGVATLIELAERLATAERPAGHRVRFAFWGAEELGLYGSRRYVASLSRSARRQIGAYVNLDMTGSPNPARLVYDGAAGPKGSQRIEDALRASFRAARLKVGQTGMRDGSDHAPFARAGIPVGGLFAGAEQRKSPAQARRYGGTAGRAFDPCYHRACDTVANVDERGLGELARASADAITALAR